MKPAINSTRYFEKTKLMIVQSEKILHETVGDLADYLRAGDLLLVNSASTMPSSFHGVIERSGSSVEIRLSAFRGKSARDLRYWSAVSFGAGNWREPTENRGPAPELVPGDKIRVSKSLLIVVVSLEHSRLLKIKFVSDHLVQDLFLAGRPIQYSYHVEDLRVWDQQTLFAGAPISVEPPSASFPLTWDLIFKLQSRGVRIAPVLHSAGISSTGDPALDARLPLEEYYEVPQETLDAIAERRGRVVALGTSVTRAVESAMSTGERIGLTSLKLGPASEIHAVDVLITGMHEEGSSHAELMKAFCGCDQLAKSETEANARGYRSHEFGDLTLLDCASKFV